jgi:flagellar motility protein MotE (MotC chaperone)
MNPRTWLWILAPLALSFGVLWLSAQEPKPTQPEGIKVSELAEKLQAKDKSLAQKERDLMQLEQRLATLQSTLDKDRMDLQTREKTLQEALAKLQNERSRPTIDPQITRTYEAMDPAQAAKALKELAARNEDVAVSLLASMQAKKAGKLLDQLAGLEKGGAELAGKLSEKVALSKAATPAT